MNFFDTKINLGGKIFTRTPKKKFVLKKWPYQLTNICNNMSFNPLFIDDTLFLIIQWINKYQSFDDIQITKLCLRLTCRLFQNKIELDNCGRNFFQILTSSTINNQEIFNWFYHPSQYNNIWTFCYSASKGDLITLALCHQNCFSWYNMVCHCWTRYHEHGCTLPENIV